MLYWNCARGQKDTLAAPPRRRRVPPEGEGLLFLIEKSIASSIIKTCAMNTELCVCVEIMICCSCLRTRQAQVFSWTTISVFDIMLTNLNDFMSRYDCMHHYHRHYYCYCSLNKLENINVTVVRTLYLHGAQATPRVFVSNPAGGSCDQT